MINLRDVSFGYTGDTYVLDRFSLAIEPAQLTAVTGPSGCGKSTLLYLIGLLLTPSGGWIHVDGIDVAGLDDSSRSQIRSERIGFVFQDALLDPSRAVLDNVTEGAIYANQSRKSARALGVALLEELGVNVPFNRRPGEVSGGQAQRIALCRALCTEPQIILADEPTGNLDRASADVVLDVLRQQALLGRTVVIATHDLTVRAKCDRVIEL